ncbi:unnamed protein product [Cylicostephanus goldi]|uniref:Uncharacterized protein n=1 Tax=Cylicostephanus goldi TaxID=71465 RepID=A0A3P6T8V4_CYLGO|nr:unnamed protein product [Cylicostephanus goldi]
MLKLLRSKYVVVSLIWVVLLRTLRVPVFPRNVQHLLDLWNRKKIKE